MTEAKSKENLVFICLGSNLGDPKIALENARSAVSIQIGFIINASYLYQTSPWGLASQNYFLNQVIEVKTSLSPNEVLQKCLAIEIEMGRIRNEKFGPRCIDIDILFFNELVVNEPDLKIPHPLLHERRFVLAPMLELNATFIHPILLKTIRHLYDVCEDIGTVKIIL